ncbi:MAG TPA: hypothetical protein VFD33_07170 [Bacillota bacterium]|nr:hypothetical protein [Bacillota bacterium]
MAGRLNCLRCGSTMYRGDADSKGVYKGIRSDGMVGMTKTTKYMCGGCGYIEERAINAKHLFKSFDYQGK